MRATGTPPTDQSERLRALFHHFIPASLYGGQTAFGSLSRIESELQKVHHPDAAARLLETAKPGLYTALCGRFSPSIDRALAVKNQNNLRAPFHLRIRSDSVISRPIGLIIDPSNVCQLACPGCVHSTRSKALGLFDWPVGTLSEDLFSVLLRLYGPYAIGVYLCNYGEPLLNLNTPKLIRLAKTYLLAIGLSTSLSVRRFDADAYVESGLDYMVLSIDGATQRVYERFRANGDLELVIDNIRKLVSAKRKLGKRTPVLSWNFLAFEHNAHEITAAACMARALGVDQFQVMRPFNISWDDPQIRPATLKPGIGRLEWRSATNRPENWNPFPDGLDDAAFAKAFNSPWPIRQSTGSPPSSGHTCHWLYKDLAMDATGRILPCSCAPKPEVNLVFATFEGNNDDPFNSEKYRKARAWFTGATPLSCDTPHCARCEWDQTRVDIGGSEIRRYFRAADASFFDRRSLRILSEW